MSIIEKAKRQYRRVIRENRWRSKGSKFESLRSIRNTFKDKLETIIEIEIKGPDIKMNKDYIWTDIDGLRIYRKIDIPRYNIRINCIRCNEKITEHIEYLYDIGRFFSQPEYNICLDCKKIESREKEIKESYNKIIKSVNF